MAALPELSLPALVDLRRVSPEMLGGVLDEEVRVWRERLDWDFRASAELVLRFVGMRSLSGYALVAGEQALGYSYFVCEENKGLIGDLYVLAEFSSIENENLLLEGVLDALAAVPFVHRVECQLMMLTSCFGRPLPRAAVARIHRRNYMSIDVDAVRSLPAGRLPAALRIEAWTERRQDEAARLIARSYQGHIDSEINDQYRSTAGARRFLNNIIQYPGCGAFLPSASLVAVEPHTGRVLAMCLASVVAIDVGHVTQICVDPAARGAGAGYEILRQSLLALADHGCRSVSLTVTAANREAIRLYDRMGFTIGRSFAAYVWDGI